MQLTEMDDRYHGHEVITMDKRLAPAWSLDFPFAVDVFCSTCSVPARIIHDGSSRSR